MNNALNRKITKIRSFREKVCKKNCRKCKEIETVDVTHSERHDLMDEVYENRRMMNSMLD